MELSRPILATSLTANAAFKLKYPRYLKGAVLVALALTALFVWLWPGYQAEPYQLRKPEIFEVVLLEPVPTVVLPPKPEEVPRLIPEVEPAPIDDPEALDTIPDPMPIDTPIDPTIYPPARDEGFVPSSAEPELTYQVKAEYPEIARRAGLEGTVLVHVRVNSRGQVDKVEIGRSVHPILDKAALTAALRCRFTPATQRKIPVPVWVAIPYRFRLR